MSTVEKTEAVVLKSMPYLETSKIVTFYTRRFGRLSTIVKGARRSTNKYGSSLEPMSHDLIVVYRKEGRDLQTLSQCDSLHSFRGLHEDLEKMSAGMAMIELISMVARDEEENGPLFSLLTDSLAAVEHATKNPSIVLYWFEVRLAGILGFRPSFGVCATCGKSLAENGPESGLRRFLLEKGGPVCEACSAEPGRSLMLGSGVLRVLHDLSRISSAAEAARVDPGQDVGRQIRDFVRMYLGYHVHGMRPLKSDRVFSRILG
jgi:DNA repair protein RecO (recombination protein O)